MADKSTKILITGGAGYLGSRLARDLSSDYEVVVTVHETPCPVKGLESIKVDLLDFDTYETLIDDSGADILIHTAAWSTIDECQQNEDDAYAVNADATESLLEQMSDVGGYAIVISTDQVFDGKKPPYLDNSPAKPLSLYGQTKAEAEGLVDPSMHLALRLPLLYGKSEAPKKSFFEHMIEEIKAGHEVICFSDQLRTPLALFQTSRAIKLLLEKRPKGLMNLAGTESISRFDFGVRVARLAGLEERLVRPGSQAKHPMGKFMPKDVSLKNKASYAYIDRALLTLDDGIKGSLAELGL